MLQSPEPMISDDTHEQFEQIPHFVPVPYFIAVNPLNKFYQFQHNIVLQTYYIIPLVIFLDWRAHSVVTKPVPYKSFKLLIFNYERKIRNS
jgi:hypothetical protein